MDNIVSSQDLVLPLEYPVKSGDGIDIDIKIQVVAIIGNYNIFKQKTNLNPSTSEISPVAAYLSGLDELKNLLKSESSAYSAEQLLHDQAVANQITIKIEGTLSQVLQENGLQFVRISALNPGKIETQPQPSISSASSSSPQASGKSSNFWHVPFIATIALLIVIIVVFIASHSSASATISKKDKTIAALQNKIDPAKEQLAAMQAKIKEAGDILNLSLSTTEAKEVTINQYGGQSTNVVTFNAKYAGYVVITGQSTSNNGLINVTNKTDDQTFIVPNTFYSDTAQIVPVLPGTVAVEFTNVNILNGATTTLTVVYHY